MVENFDPAQTGKAAEAASKDGAALTENVDGQAENLATKDPSATLLESTQTQVAGTKAEEAQVQAQVAEAENSAGFSTADYVLGAGLFAAGAGLQKYGINRQLLAAAGRGIETLKTAATGVADLSPYAKVAARNADTLGADMADRLRGSLRLGGDFIDKSGKVFMGSDATVVSTTKGEFLGLNPINAINRYGDAAQFLKSSDGVHSFTSTVGKGPIRGFDLKYEANSMLGTDFATATLRDGNRFAKFMPGQVLEGRGVFTEMEMNAALRQGQKATDALYQSVVKTTKA
jgi:hypothetical protein